MINNGCRRCEGRGIIYVSRKEGDGTILVDDVICKCQTNGETTHGIVNNKIDLFFNLGYNHAKKQDEEETKCRYGICDGSGYTTIGEYDNIEEVKCACLVEEEGGVDSQIEYSE